MNMVINSSPPPPKIEFDKYINKGIHVKNKPFFEFLYKYLDDLNSFGSREIMALFMAKEILVSSTLILCH